MLKLVLLCCLCVLVAAGCGGGGHSQSHVRPALPRALAQRWAGQASAIADAAAAGNSCGALHLASSLRNEVISEQAKVPSHLRLAVVTGVNALADRLVCAVPPQTVTVQPSAPKPPPKPKPHEHHGHHGHGGDNGDQG